MQEFTAQGKWWIPGAKRRNATGTIRYSPAKGTALEVFGSRLDDPTQVLVPVVHGDTDLGPMTLLDCTVQRWTSSGHEPSGVAQFVESETLIKGGHLTKESLYHGFTLQVESLNEWARLGTIASVIADGHLARYFKQPLAIPTTLSDGTKVSLGAAVSEQVGAFTLTIDGRHTFVGEFATRKTLDVVIDEYVAPLRDLVATVVDQSVRVVSLNVSRQGMGQYDLRLDVGLRLPVSDFESSVHAEHLVTFTEFDFASRLPVWFDLYRKLRGIHGLIQGIRYPSTLPAENVYLNASTAAEALHRETFRSKRAKIELSTPATTTWLQSFPEEERELIKTRLNQYINDPSLADRLKDLCTKAGSAFAAMVQDPDEWISLVKQVRNGLTHQKGVSKRRVSQGEMYLLAESLRLLVTVCILIDLGFTEQDVMTMLFRPIRSQITRAEFQRWMNERLAQRTAPAGAGQGQG